MMLLSFFLSPAFAEPNKINLLIIHGDTPLNRWSTKFDSGLTTACSQHIETASINYYFEYLDSTKIVYDTHYNDLSSYLRRKYGNIKFDGAIADNAEASSFLKQHSNYLPDVPIIYMSLKETTLSDRELNLTFEYDEAVRKTLLMIKEQNTELKKIYLIKTPYFLSEKIETYMKEYINILGKTELVVIQDFTIEELYERVSNLPQGSVLVYTPIVFDKNKQRIDAKYAVKKLSENPGIKIYTFWTNFIGYGVIGGAMIDSKIVATEMVNEILHYKKNKTFKNHFNNIRIVIDWDMVKKNNIPRSKIPHDSIIKKKPLSPFKVYFNEIVTIIIIVVSIFLVITLFWLKSMSESRKKLKDLAEKDPLTNLYNRRAILPNLHYEINRKNRYNAPVSIIILDIDYFKRINDNFGHETGDIVLTSIAELLKKFCRSSDRISRWGGEEFLLLLPETSANNALKLAEKLRKIISEKDFHKIGKITASFGVAELKKNETFSQWFERADNALYKSKSDGRNKVTKD
ncbi:MAG: GGDEF domain-containing protein [Spirochaetales bacterium]|nr:GGDEF domain-containing protein [Spirochaetales bacterium]